VQDKPIDDPLFEIRGAIRPAKRCGEVDEQAYCEAFPRHRALDQAGEWDSA